MASIVRSLLQFPRTLPALVKSTAALQRPFTSLSFGSYLPGTSQSKVLASTNSFLKTPLIILSRNLVKYSKKGKHKTVKAVAKRFHRTGTGKLKYWPAGNNHKMLSKSFNERRLLRKPKYANKQQLKLLNNMISGW